MTQPNPQGLHHVTAIAGDPQRNLDFYHGVLGLRLVKQTVNFDAPDTYHLYFGDEVGSPGSIMTFFPAPGAPSGRHGAGQATTTGFSVPSTALGWWDERLRRLGVEVLAREERGDEDVLALSDPDGLRLELVADARGDTRTPWEAGPVPAEVAIRGLSHVTLTEHHRDRTAAHLTEQLGFRVDAEHGHRTRFVTGQGAVGQRVDVLARPDAPRGLVAAGTVHHIAWRAPERATQERWRAALAESGVDLTPIVDRQYFTSIYFREPGGVLFEIATDTPGFATDEVVAELGRELRLPPWLEPQRERIAASLPALALPGDPGDHAPASAGVPSAEGPR